MADTSKDTIYIDVEDEITGVIDKVLASDKKLVALVLPKRASVFQSVVNMKLLKRKADAASKDLVLVTTESSLLPLAGSVGLFVAKTLSSKPEIPQAPLANGSIVEAGEDDPISMADEEPDVDLQALAAAPIGVLAGEEIKNKALDPSDVETIELDNTPVPEEAAGAVADEKISKKKPKKDKSLKVPNFERFRKWGIIGLLALIVILVGGFLILRALPKATIDIKTDAANVSSTVNFTMSTSAQTLDPSTNTVPAKLVNETKTYTATVNSTGQQNNGQKASGSVTISAGACSGTAPNDVPAGTGLNSTNNLTYITQEDTTFVPKTQGKNCTWEGLNANNKSSSIDITAQNGGSNYNVSNANFSAQGYPGITANGSASGGTDDIVQTVTQSDINNAESKITTNASGAKQDLTNQLNQANFYPVNETFTTGSPTNTENASAGTAASTVTVTQTINYTMYGVNFADLQTLVDSSINSQGTGGKQNILSNGLNNATYTSNGSPTALTVQTTAVVGPQISVSQVKADAAGKKSADIQAIVGQIPHVTSVNVTFSPFYVTTAPTNTSKISVHIAQPTNNGNNAN
jgi:hypothetical protein